MKRVIGVLAAVASLVAVATAIAAAAFPDRIELPDGFRPEGISAGKGNQLFVGSIPTGEVRTVDAKSGDVDPLVPARPGERAAIGLKADHRDRLFVAGGPRGAGYVYDADTGEDLAVLKFTESADTFVNDVALTRDAAYFTDSRRSALYVVRDDLGGFSVLELPGVPLGPGNNLNGIVATPDGRTLIAVRGGEYGALYRIDPRTGESRRIELTGGDGDVRFGDGLLLTGTRTLYVVQNRANRIAVVRLDEDLESGRITRYISAQSFDVPTTVARLGNRLYLPNARFTTPPQPTTDYWITQVAR